jgi:hypothetical protein
VAIENVSYYCAPGAEMSELEFITAVLARADCDLLLDLNNIYVNSINHAYDAVAFLRALPASRLAYAHVAGHYREADDLVIDTHAAAVSAPVWALLEVAYAHFGVFPTLLERDFNLPPLTDLMAELGAIDRLQRARPLCRWSGRRGLLGPCRRLKPRARATCRKRRRRRRRRGPRSSHCNTSSLRIYATPRTPPRRALWRTAASRSIASSCTRNVEGFMARAFPVLRSILDDRKLARHGARLLRAPPRADAAVPTHGRGVPALSGAGA